ncbi:MAG: FG-GAP repeat protein [Planctomycetes bacterium]|nr:FG-GAP repeat protein [Planctomycetota bacterium]
MKRWASGSAAVAIAGVLAAAPVTAGEASDPRVAGQVLVAWGDQSGDRFGAALVAPGDVDGDGRADLAVGASGRDGVQPSAGRVSLLSSDGALLWQLEGDEAFARLGSALASAGDVDGDGVPDVAAGEPSGAGGKGRLCVLSGVDGALLLQVDGAAQGDRFGSSLAGVGDVDRDGVPDLLVGAPDSDAGGTNAGRACVLSGADGSELAAWQGETFDLFGLSVAAAGDVDLDGVPDVLVGAPFDDGGAFNGGALVVLPGQGGDALGTLFGAGVGDQLGTWVAGVGDVDGDGVPDAAAGAPGDDGSALDAGAVHVRAGAGGAQLLVIAGQGEGEGLGVVCGAGDLDGDGRADLAVGAPSSDAAGDDAGRVRLVSASGAELCAADGFGVRAWLGAALTALGDTDGDGRPEVAAGAPVHDDVLSRPGRLVVLGCVPFAPGAVADPPLAH